MAYPTLCSSLSSGKTRIPVRARVEEAHSSCIRPTNLIFIPDDAETSRIFFEFVRNKGVDTTGLREQLGDVEFFRRFDIFRERLPKIQDIVDQTMLICADILVLSNLEVIDVEESQN